MPRFYLDELDQDLAYARCESFGGGMDSFTRSTLLPPDAYQYGENIIVPDNMEARTRPGADRIATNLTDPIQGLFYFDTPSVEQLIAVANKKYYQVGSALTAWTEMTGYAAAAETILIAMAQGVDTMLTTDGATYAIWNGTAWTTLTTNDTDPPVGASVLLWHAGRMWAAGFPGTGGAGKENDAVCASALLSFGNGDWSLTDRSFRVGGGEGDPVIGLCSMPASTPGQAILGVLKQNSIHLVRTDPTASITQYSSTLVPEAVANGLGVVGKRAYAVLGNDLFFVAPDKSFRSLARMEAAAQQYQVSPPLSLPLQPYIELINWDYAKTIVVSRYQQYALFAVPLAPATSPNTVFVWSARLNRWVGMWTGWTPQAMTISRFGGTQRLMIGDASGNVNRWKDYADDEDDATYLDNGTDIATKLWTRAFLFEEPLNDKDHYHFESRFSSSNATITFTIIDDNAEAAKWSQLVQPSGPYLEIDLPFDLQAENNIPVRKGLRGRPHFNETYVRVESAEGWWALRNLSLSAFLTTLNTR